MKTTQNSKTFKWLRIAGVVLLASFLQQGFGQSEKPSHHPKPSEIIEKLEPSLIVPVFGARSAAIRSENAKVRQKAAEWQRSIDDKTVSEGISVGDGSFGLLGVDDVTKALGKPDRETKQLLSPLTKLNGVALLVRDGDSLKATVLSDPNNAKFLVGRVLWYGPIGLGFLKSGTTSLESLSVMLHSNVSASPTVEAKQNAIPKNAASAGSDLTVPEKRNTKIPN